MLTNILSYGSAHVNMIVTEYPSAILDRREPARKELQLLTHVSRTYRITIDIETASYPEPPGTLSSASHAFYVHSHEAVLQRLQAHFEILDSLLHSLVIGKMDEAKKMLAAEYCRRTSEQELLQPILAELEPEAQAYLIEEIEDGFQMCYFDGFAANVRRYDMRMLDESR